MDEIIRKLTFIRKSEDKIPVGEGGDEILFAIRGWPVVAIEVDGQVIERPDALLVVE